MSYKISIWFELANKLSLTSKKKIYFPDSYLNKVVKKDIGARQSKKYFPRISIVMVSFNQDNFIERSILSVLNQEYPNLQFIIIDGGSTDSTVKIIKKYDKYIDFWTSCPDRGQSDALNKGFLKADGEIYGWLNSDDLYLPKAFFTSVTAFQKHSDKLVVFGDWLFIDENDTILDCHHAFDFNLNHFKYEGFHLSAQSMFWKASLHKKFTGFNLELYNTMDYQMILEFGLLSEKKFFRIPKTLGAFRIHKKQKTNNNALKRIEQEHILLAYRYNYVDKYNLIGCLKRYYFRNRRALWYLKRGGVLNLLKRFIISYKKN